MTDLCRQIEFFEDVLHSLKSAKSLRVELEKTRLAAAMYKAYLFRRDELAKKLEDQNTENVKACVGAYDGFCYSSDRAKAVFRTIEDMVEEGIISADDLDFCRVL